MNLGYANISFFYIVQSHSVELDSQRDKIATLDKTIDELLTTKKTLERDLKESQQETQEANSDISTLNAQLSRLDEESQLKDMKITELKKALVELSDRYQTHIRESESFSVREEEFIRTLRTKDAVLEENERKIDNLEKQLRIVTDDRDSAVKVKNGLEKQVHSLQAQELNSINEVQRRIQQVKQNRVLYQCFGLLTFLSNGTWL